MGKAADNYFVGSRAVRAALTKLNPALVILPVSALV
jgi:hypothetical protein